MIQRIWRVSALVAALCALLYLPGLAMAQDTASSSPRVQVNWAVAHGATGELKHMSPVAGKGGDADKPLIKIPKGQQNRQNDPVIQSSPGVTVSASSGAHFPGVGQGDYGFGDFYAPPDTNMAVGATQVVQWVNASFAVFDKSGHLLYGPTAGNTLWKSLTGSGCAVNNDGDPIAQYDAMANRWIMTQFSVSSPSKYHYLQCVAVSQTSDATGAWNLYVFDYGTTKFPDYPKLGVWPDAYYISYNIFNKGTSWAGPMICAFDRNAMLSGQNASQQCYQLSTAYDSLLPADLDGSTPPPAGSPGMYLSYGANSLNLWQMHVDFANSTNSTLSNPISIPVAAFNPACGGGTCIPQPGTSQQLDSLADRLMYRLAYRNFGDHEALVVNHSVNGSSGQSGIRWYELRNPAGSTFGQATATNKPVVYQQGTYAPDSNYRWMGSIAMDHVGDIAVGYSVSSSSKAPSIAFTGRVPTDPADTLEAETTILNGVGSQLSNLSRWGDYSAMRIDPADDCTFWYTNEYLKASGTFNWSTYIYSFTFPGCSSGTVTVPNAPSGLGASAVSSSQINLSWTDNSTNESGFNIMRAAPGASYTKVGQVGANVTSFQDTGLSASTTYDYQVVAYNSAGNSGPSNTASAQTQAAGTVPAAPSGLTATAVSKSQINLKWNDNSDNETSFVVQQSTNGRGWSTIATLGANTTTYSDTGLSGGKTYYYQVYATNSAGNSAYSNTASAKTPRR